WATRRLGEGLPSTPGSRPGGDCDLGPALAGFCRHQRTRLHVVLPARCGAAILVADAGSRNIHRSKSCWLMENRQVDRAEGPRPFYAMTWRNTDTMNLASSL